MSPREASNSQNNQTWLYQLKELTKAPESSLVSLDGAVRLLKFTRLIYRSSSQSNQGNRYIWPNTVIYWPALTGEGWGWEPHRTIFKFSGMLQPHGVNFTISPQTTPFSLSSTSDLGVSPGTLKHLSPPIEVLFQMSFHHILRILYTWFKRGHSWTLLHSETIGIHLHAVLTSILAHNIGAPNTR